MRALGYRTVDLLVELATRLPDEPPLRRGTREEMEARLREPSPAGPLDFGAILEQLRTDVLPFRSRCDHPSFFAFIPGSGTWPGALGDFIASACNVYAGSWMESAGPSQVELVVLDWFKEWIGYPAEAAGVLVTGGSAANMAALACAREARTGAMTDDVVAYVSDQAHSSMARAGRILGFRPDQVRVLPVDERHRLRPEFLARAMDADVRAARRPLFASALAGSTNTGAVDPLPELAEVCRERGVWLHVDAAYGGFAALTERGRSLLEGLELADSVALDPHKWLYQPFECGCLLVRDGRLLREAFEITPDYLKEAQIAGGEVNFSDLGLQLTRMARALKLWMSLKFFGVDAFRRAIDRSIDLALAAQRRIEESPSLELLSPASLGVVCFRRRIDGVDDERLIEEGNSRLVRGLEASGEGLVSSTRLRGRFVLRLCVLNHSSAWGDVDRVLEWLERAPVALEPPHEVPAALSEHDRHSPPEQGWLGRVQLGNDELRALPLLASLADAELERVASSATERIVAPGVAVVEQWDTSRDFYVILEGSAEAWAGGELVATLGAGDFFGELAALDWGASFGYPRLASVVATSETRLLVLPTTTFNRLVREVPSVGDRIRRAVRERLQLR